MSRQTLVQSLDDVGFGAGPAQRGQGTLWQRAWRAASKIFSGDERTKSRRQRPIVAESPAAADNPVASSAMEHTMETGTSNFTNPIGDDVQPTVIGVGHSPEPAATPSVPQQDTGPLRRYCESILYSLRKSAGDDEQLPRVIGVTSCYAGEGVTTLASELALAAAAGNRSVLLADANVGSAGLHKLFRTNLSPGLAESFHGGPSLEQAVRTLPGTNLSFCTAGQANRGPQVDHADGLRQLAQFAAERYDFAVVDLPPLDRPAETLPLCGVLDGVLLLVEAERVRWPVAERFVGELTRSDAKPLGVVMNKQKHHVPQWLYRTL